MEGSLGEHHAGELHREAARAKAQRIVAEALERRGWRETDLARRRKSGPCELEMAARLRRETTLSLKETAARVHLGTSKTANAKLHAHKRGAAPKAFGASERMKPNEKRTKLWAVRHKRPHRTTEEIL